MAKGKPRIRRHTVEWEGENYRLAKLSKGKDIPVEEKVKISKVICMMYETDLYSLIECCAKVGINDRTFFKWRNEITEIADLFIGADREKEIIYRHNLRQRGRTNAERLMEGFTKEVEDKSYEAARDENGNVILDENGEPKMILVSKKVKQLFIRPSVRMTETSLFNSDSRVFEKNPKPTEKINKDVDIPPVQWVGE